MNTGFSHGLLNLNLGQVRCSGCDTLKYIAKKRKENSNIFLRNALKLVFFPQGYMKDLVLGNEMG